VGICKEFVIEFRRGIDGEILLNTKEVLLMNTEGYTQEEEQVVSDRLEQLGY